MIDRFIRPLCGAGAMLCAMAPHSTSSQTLLELAAGIKFCRTLTDDMQRLKCFDSLFAELGKTPSAATPAAPPSWTVEETKSPIDDSPQIQATLKTEDDAVLVLRCKEHKTEAFFVKRLSFFGIADNVKVVTRVNDGQAIETTWSSSTDHEAVFAPSAVQFIKSLPDWGKIFIRATGFQGKTAEGLFPLGKISDVRDKIAASCRWKPG